MHPEKHLPELMAEKNSLDPSFVHAVRLLAEGKSGGEFSALRLLDLHDDQPVRRGRVSLVLAGSVHNFSVLFFCSSAKVFSSTCCG